MCCLPYTGLPKFAQHINPEDTNAMFAKTLDNTLHFTPLTTKNQS
jgi:hypothetical protein